MLLDQLRTQWRCAAPGGEKALVAEITAWQKGFSRFASVGLIGTVNGPKRWLEPVSPLVTEQAIKFQIPESTDGSDVILSLITTHGGDGNAGDVVLWQRLRLVAAGRPDVLLRDVPKVTPNGMFGKRPDGSEVEATDLCVSAPSVIEIHLPADLAKGCELVSTCVVDPKSGREGTVQLQVVAGRAELPNGLRPSETAIEPKGAAWTDADRAVASSLPILVAADGDARRRVKASIDEFRRLFPASLCYTKIVPVDEVVTLTLFHREDDHLRELMLDDEQSGQLDKLWDELHFVSQDAFGSVDAFEQILEFASQDADPKVFEPLRQPIYQRAAKLREWQTESESKQLRALVAFAE